MWPIVPMHHMGYRFLQMARGTWLAAAMQVELIISHTHYFTFISVIVSVRSLLRVGNKMASLMLWAVNYNSLEVEAHIGFKRHCGGWILTSATMWHFECKGQLPNKAGTVEIGQAIKSLPI